MKLFIFPRLVYQNIMKQMKYGELFFLSLCSKNSVKVIQSVNWKEIEEMEYYSNQKMIRFRVIDGKGLTQMLVLDPCFKCSTRKVTVFNKDLLFGRSMDKSVVLLIDVSQQRPFLNKVLGHINALFGKHLNWSVWSENGCQLPEKIQTIETYFTLRTWKVLRASVLEEFFERNPVQKNLALDAGIKGQFRPDSKIFSASTLCIHSSSMKTKHLLYNFKGRELFMVYTVLQPDTCLQFLKKWQSKEILQNLEFIIIVATDLSDFNLALIRKELNIKRLPESITHPRIEFNSRFHVSFPELPGKAVSAYIVNNDGIVAFLKITDQFFLFSVKKLTENEMLEGNATAQDQSS